MKRTQVVEARSTHSQKRNDTRLRSNNVASTVSLLSISRRCALELSKCMIDHTQELTVSWGMCITKTTYITRCKCANGYWNQSECGLSLTITPVNLNSLSRSFWWPRASLVCSSSFYHHFTTSSSWRKARTWKWNCSAQLASVSRLRLNTAALVWKDPPSNDVSSTSGRTGKRCTIQIIVRSCWNTRRSAGSSSPCAQLSCTVVECHITR